MLFLDVSRPLTGIVSFYHQVAFDLSALCMPSCGPLLDPVQVFSTTGVVDEGFSSCFLTLVLDCSFPIFS